MNLVSIIKRVFISSLAALPTSLLYFGYEGSVIRGTGWLGTAFWVLIIAMLGCVVIGLPVHFAMQRRNIKSRLAYGAAGFFSALAFLASVPILFMDWGELVDRNNFEVAIIFAIAGAAVALAFREMQEY